MNLIEVPLVDGGVKFGGSVIASTASTWPAPAATRRSPSASARSTSRSSRRAASRALAVTVNVVEELGADGFVYGTTSIGGEDTDIVVRVHGRHIPRKGETIHVVPTGGETHVFSSTTGARLSA